MAAIVLTHFRVADQVKWRKNFDDHASLRQGHGCTGTHVFYNAADSNDVFINLQWDSAENVQKFHGGPGSSERHG